MAHPGGPRVALCFGSYPPQRNGGADFAARFSAELAANGAAVHVLTSAAAAAGTRDVTPAGVTAHRVVEDWRLRGGRASLRRLRSILDSERIEVVHVLFPDSDLQGDYQLPAMLGLGQIPLVTTFWSLGLGRRSPVPLRLEAAALLARSAVLSSHDPVYLAALRRLTLGIKPVRWLPVGSNFPANGRRRRNDGPVTLGFFGKLDFTRGVDTLFAALARLGRPDVRLVMLGSAAHPERYTAHGGTRAEFTRLRRLPTDLGIAGVVEWTDFIPDDDVPDVLADLDVCVLPYRRNSIGRSGLAAALAAGVPVILGGRPGDIVPLRDGEHVALVPPDDVAALAAAIGNLADDPRRREALAAGARAGAAHFAWPRIAQRALDLYREAMR